MAVLVTRPHPDDDQKCVFDIWCLCRYAPGEEPEVKQHISNSLEEFKGRNTTTEFLARAIFDRVVAAIHRGDLGAQASGISTVRVALHESHVAWAAFEGPVGRG